MDLALDLSIIFSQLISNLSFVLCLLINFWFFISYCHAGGPTPTLPIQYCSISFSFVKLASIINEATQQERINLLFHFCTELCAINPKIISPIVSMTTCASLTFEILFQECAA